MRTIEINHKIILILVIAGLFFVSCKKDKTEGANDYTSMTTLSQDEDIIEEAMNESMVDVQIVLNNDRSIELLSCNATLDSINTVNDTITFYVTYDGLSCNGHFVRTGQVEIQKHIGTSFISPGAVVKIKHIDFTISSLNPVRSLTINSSKTYTNVSGGHIGWLGLNNFTSLEYRTAGTISVSFDDATTQSWQVARQTIYSGTQANLTLSIEGVGSYGEHHQLVTWGTTRQGEEFTSQIITPVEFKETCNWRPVAGHRILRIQAADKSAQIMYGYDESGLPVTGNECPTHYRVDWHNGTYSGTRMLPLW